MATSRQELERLILNPRENLDTELKQWIDPSTPEAIGKIARACIALRNNNGGCLIVGVKDNGCPDILPPFDVRVAFHTDRIQAIVSKYASQPFTVDVEFIERDGVEYPIICVPSGVETPVAAKSDLLDPNNSKSPFVRCDTIYVRTINSNHTVSSSAARWNDWPDIVRRCFDNREADIGAFVRRHLSNLDLTQMSHFLLPAKPAPTVSEHSVEFLNVGKSQFELATKKHNLSDKNVGAFEVAIVIDGDFPKQSPNEDFYVLLQLNKPRHTGWSLWMGGSRGPRDNTSYVYGNAWETLVDSPIGGFDFWRAEPAGRFYHRRALWDDLCSERGIVPKTQLDFALHTKHVTEAVSIGSHFARALGCDERNTSLGFACRWTGMEGRHLGSWSEPDRDFYSRGAAVEDAATTNTVMALETPPAAFSSIVESLVAPMFELFGGMRFQSVVIERIVKKTLAERY